MPSSDGLNSSVNIDSLDSSSGRAGNGRDRVERNSMLKEANSDLVEIQALDEKLYSPSKDYSPALQINQTKQKVLRGNNNSCSQFGQENKY